MHVGTKTKVEKRGVLQKRGTFTQIMAPPIYLTDVYTGEFVIQKKTRES